MKTNKVATVLVHDFELTPASQSVAWNGTLQIIRKHSRYYLVYHSGNSNHAVINRTITKAEAETFIRKGSDYTMEFVF
jgi:hypothetical protein